MITRNRYNLQGDTNYQGLSTDEKPTEGVPVNSMFLEFDTKKFYYFNGFEWYENGTSPLLANILTIRGNTLVEEGELLNFVATSMETTADNGYVSSLNLHTAEYFPTGMKSARSVYDELTPTKATTRVGSFHFDGTEDWVMENQTGGYKNFYIRSGNPRPSNAKKGTYNGITSSSDIHFRESQEDLVTAVAYSGTGTGLIQIRVPEDFVEDLSVGTFKAYLQENPFSINYELETADENYVNTNLSYQIVWGGTERIMPQESAPIIADIEYPDGERDDQEFISRTIEEAE